MSEPFDQQQEIPSDVVAVLREDEVAHAVKAVETIHTVYAVVAADPDAAADRLRRYFADPGMVATGVVVKQGEGERVRWRIPSTERTDAS